MTHQQDLVSASGAELPRVDRAAGQRFLDLGYDAIERLARDSRRVGCAHPGTGKAGVDLDAEDREGLAGLLGLTTPRVGQWPLGVRGAIRGVAVSQEPDHLSLSSYPMMDVGG